MDLATAQWLASPEGVAALGELPAYDPAAELALQTRLRGSGLPPEHVAGLLLQSRLRARAQSKFGSRADRMLFTSEGLEQATRPEVAAHHATRYAAAGVSLVHDLGCGIGSDAMALSATGIAVRAVDVDPVTAQIADANLQPWATSSARAGRAEDFTPPAHPAGDRVGVWLDPARRIPGVADPAGRSRRVFRLTEISPSWEFVTEVAREVPATGVKLSPSFAHGDIPAGSEAQWVSFGGDVVECGIWFGPLVHREGRTALLVSASGETVRVDESMCADLPASPQQLADIGQWLYEPDRAVTRAGLLGAVTALTGGAEIDPGVGYVTSEQHVTVPFARRFAVREVMPLNTKALRAWLRTRGITGVTVKKRGVRIDEDRLRRDLRITRKAGSGEHVVLVLTRAAGQSIVLVVEAA